MAIRVEQVDGVGNLMILELHLYAPRTQLDLCSLEVCSVDSESNVAKTNRISSRRPGWIRAGYGEKCQGGLPDPHHGGAATPDILMESRETKNVLVPGGRTLNISDRERHVIDSLQAESGFVLGARRSTHDVSIHSLLCTPIREIHWVSSFEPHHERSAAAPLRYWFCDLKRSGESAVVICTSLRPWVYGGSAPIFTTPRALSMRV